MTPQAPLIDSRTQDDILTNVRTLAPFYTPEWNAPQDTGAGAALTEIFADLVDGLIQRLNQVPNNNLIAYLNMLGVQLLPAQAALVPLTFYLSAGATQSALIPARSQAAANPPGGSPLVFETQAAILATPAVLQAVLGVVPETTGASSGDLILNNLPEMTSGSPTRLFDPLDEGVPNLQAHVLYLGDPDLFNLTSADSSVTLQLELNGPAALFVKNAVWSWSDVNGNWQLFTFVSGDPSTGTVTLTKAEGRAIQQVKVNGILSRWISATVRMPKGTGAADILLTNIAAGPAPPAALIPDAAFANDIPLPLPATPNTPVLPFGTLPRQNDAFYIASQDAFSKSGASVTLSFAFIAWPVLSYASPRLTSGAITSLPAPNLSWEYWNGAGWNVLPVAGAALTLQGNYKYTLSSGGAGYQQGDSLTLVQSGGSNGVIIVSGVSPGGAIQTFFVQNAGTGFITANNIPVTGGKGNGATFDLDTGQTVVFGVPQDIAQTSIGGQSDFWIRVRIGSGDYGQVLYTAGNLPDASRVYYPKISALTLSYTLTRLQTPATVMTLNNAGYQVYTPLNGQFASFQPFVPLDDASQALYLGFSEAPLSGPISIFFDLVDQAYPDAKPRLEWQYYSQASPQQPGQWNRLAIVDGTQGLTTVGTVQFLGPSDFAPLSRFGSSLYWIRAVDVNNGFQQLPPVNRDLTQDVRLPNRTAGRSPCAGQTTFSAPFAGAAATISLAPLIDNIYLNTAWAIQAETIVDETLGSSNATQNQQYQLTKFPVVSQQIEIDEFAALFLSERNALAANPDVTTEAVIDANGNITQFWVQWDPVDDLSTAGPNDRVYAIDPTFGTVQFGDGVNGKVPPVGFSNVRAASYQFGGGLAGNVAAGAITSLRTTIPLVDHVSNPVAAGGGSDTETVSAAIERGAESVKNRGRAVSAEDFEWTAFSASRDVARVLVLPDFNDQGQSEVNWVTVVIVPGTADPRPFPSFELQQIVESYLLARAPAVTVVANQIQVAGPTYVDVDVSAVLYPVSIDEAPQLETAAVSALQAFLHPLTGGPLGQGWDFGALPCFSDFYGLLGAISGVDHIENLSLNIYVVDPAGNPSGPTVNISQSNPFNGSLPSYVLIASGNHKITVQLSTSGSSS
jgi:hypothetical protein